MSIVGPNGCCFPNLPTFPPPVTEPVHTVHDLLVSQLNKTVECLGIKMPKLKF